MIGEAIGSSLPAAIGVALTPLPIIIIAIMLTGVRGARSGSFFTLGWVVGLAIVTALGAILFEEAYETEAATSTLGDLLRIAFGAALMLFGAKKGLSGLRATGVTEPPVWLASLDDVKDARSLGLGLLNAVNPKVVVLSAAAMNGIAQTGVQGGELLIAAIAYLVLATSTVTGALLVYLAGGARSRGFLESVRAFMLANTDVIVAVVMLLLGASVLGDGLSGLAGIGATQ